MAAQLINKLFKNHFGGNININNSNNDNSSVPDGEEKRELKTFEAVYMNFRGEEDDCGMDCEEIKAYSYDEALVIARQKPGRLYKLTQTNEA